MAQFPVLSWNTILGANQYNLTEPVRRRFVRDQEPEKMLQIIFRIGTYMCCIRNERDSRPEKEKSKTDEYGNVIREEVRREVGDAKSEGERSLEGIGDKMKAGAKMEDPDRDLGAQYEKKKAEEKLREY